MPFYSYYPVFIITSHLLFLKAHFLVKPNASLLGKICSPAGRRITTWPCLGIPKKSIAGLAIFSLKKINIWAGYLAWARRATARPVNTCSDVFVVVQRRKINIWAKHRWDPAPPRPRGANNEAEDIAGSAEAPPRCQQGRATQKTRKSRTQ